MGAKVVCLAGMDGYADNDYTNEARKIARDVHCPVRVQQGSFLRGVWPVFDPAERFGKYTRTLSPGSDRATIVSASPSTKMRMS